MGKSIPSLLKIQGWWKILEMKEENGTIHIRLFPKRKTARCPRCGKRTKSGYDTQPERILLHTVIGHQLVFVHVYPRRFTCRCTPGKPFREQFSGIHGTRSTTERFDEDLLRHLSGQAFKTVSEKLSLSYPSQRLRLTEAIDPMIPRWDLLASLNNIHLGLDGHHVVNKQFVETINEVKVGIPLGILPNDRQITIKQALETMPEYLHQRVQSISVDMASGTINTVRKVFPQAAIVIDHFHVIQDANRRLDEARRIEIEVINQERAKKGKGKIDIPSLVFRKAKEHLLVKGTKDEPCQLTFLLKRYPRLKVWYEHKERLRAIYTAANRKEADERLTSLILAMRTSDDGNLVQWGKTLTMYKEEILNYFLYRTTNAYTEGLNVRCKLVQRISSGFRNVDVYIRKAMLVLLPLSVAVTSGVYSQHYPLSLS